MEYAYGNPNSLKRNHEVKSKSKQKISFFNCINQQRETVLSLIHFFRAE